MRNSVDFSSWQGILSTLLGLVVVSLVAVGIRLLLMHSVQQRRERQNRQINERLKTLIAAYKVLGGSFTGDLAVDPSHRRELRAAVAPRETAVSEMAPGETALEADPPVRPGDTPGSERRRRIRDAVEAALSDVILLGTELQVRLAVRAATDMTAGRTVETAELVVALRTFIRDVLDLDPISPSLAIPKQGPVRASTAAPKRGVNERNSAGGSGGGRGGAAQGGGDGLAGMGMHGQSKGDPDDAFEHAAHR